jgi:oligopeptide transport system ATP-binding protein
MRCATRSIRQAADSTMALLSVRDLSVTLKARGAEVRAVDGISFDVQPGESVGIVGESGSGKTQTALAIVGLLPPRALARGSVTFDGQQLLGLAPRKLRRIRGAQIGLVFQDPLASLNPYLTIGAQMAEVAQQHLAMTRDEALRQAAEMLERVRLAGAEAALARYPHEFSGGMRQRIAIAMMLLCKPKLLIADEPTSALDVTIQAQVLCLLAELQRDLGLALLLISHDLGVIGELCSRTLVMYGGRLMEAGLTASLLAQPSHPYTQALIASRNHIDAPRDAPLKPIHGQPPDPSQPLPGCPFHPRCASAYGTCERVRPTARTTPAGSVSACHLHDH